MTQYVHVRHTNGADDMIPEHSAKVQADAGLVEIVDPTPAPYRRLVAEPSKPGRKRPGPPQANKVAAPVVAEKSAPVGAVEPEEAQA